METAMEDKKKKMKQHNNNSCPAVVVSNGCSGFRSSCVSLCRPGPFSRPQAPLPVSESAGQGIPLQQPPAESTSTPLLPSFFSNGEAAAQAYWKRCKQLERELQQLDRWLHAEKKVAEECAKNTASVPGEARDPELMRLPDGSYLREVKKVGRPWGRLAMQLSTPTVAENTSSAVEVLCQMTSMKPGDLHSYLVESMPMADISGHSPDQTKGKLVLPGSGTGDFLENMLLGAVEKMEGLAMEGLRIQMGTTSGRAEILEKKVEEKSKDKCVVHVMMIQIRDPRENYEAVGDPMVGIVEATAGEVAGRRRVDVHGVHAAGTKSTAKLSDGKHFMWSASLRGRKSSCCCCWHYVRNPDRFFLHE